ncbi:MAG: hypothetical protein J5I91_00285 [Bacteroidetes bacterium]|nr:hypothetical protein [Bacteroidota bacterium]
MKNIILIAVIFCFGKFDFGNTPVDTLMYSQDSLFNQVVAKLESDKGSCVNFEKLFNTYYADFKVKDSLHTSYYDLYLSMYNQGFPLVRLIRKESMDSVFSQLVSNRKRVSRKLLATQYCNIVINKDNFNTDNDIGGEGSQNDYFRRYLNGYLILPESR